MNLMIVDDDPNIRSFLSTAMKQFGHRVDIASNGLEAIDLLMTNGYDIIVTDAEMPGMDGIELCKVIKSQFSDIIIIGISGSHAIIELKDAGADICLSKPFSISDLDEAISSRYRFPLPPSCLQI